MLSTGSKGTKIPTVILPRDTPPNIPYQPKSFIQANHARRELCCPYLLTYSFTTFFDSYFVSLGRNTAMP